MLRATVVDVDPRDPTRVWVTIPQKYGTKPVRVFTRVQVTKGDHVYVTNTSVTRIPQWVVFGQQSEIGRWGNPYPHEHPMGQVDGLVDWVKQYEAWTKDHQARLDAADKQIADSKLVVAQTRKDLDQAQTDIADAVRKATVEQARLDQAEANLDQMGRNLLAAGGRISANETALADSQKRLDAAETTVQKAQEDLEDGPGLAAKVAGFLTVSAMTGVFTKSLTAQDATLLGETVAESINITGTLRGRDAILDGTLDVAQLNVTGEMSAKIISTATLQARQGFFTDGLTAQDATLLGTTVAENLVVTDAFSARVVNAMTAQTKQLVVTEDAILNRATVVQSLVTPELITQKADINTLAANMVAAGAIVSKDSTGSVQITPAGVTAQNATPGGLYTRRVQLTPAGLVGGTRTRQTVRIDGDSNFITGSFATAESGARVNLLSGPTSGVVDVWGSTTDGHGSVWYDTTSNDVINHSLTLMGISDYSSNVNNPAIRMFPYRGTFAFQGRWAQDTDPMKFVVVTNSSGLRAGEYNTFSIPYRTAFPTNNALRFPLLSVESANGADMMATIVTQTQSAITISVINKSGSKASGALIVKIATFNVGSY